MPAPPPPEEHRFKPGAEWRGNAGGRPKGRSITARLRELLDATEVNGKPIKGDRQVADLVAEAILRGARRGDAKLIRELLDRTEGKVPDRHSVAGDLTIRVEYADPDPAEAPPGPGGVPP